MHEYCKCIKATIPKDYYVSINYVLKPPQTDLCPIHNKQAFRFEVLRLLNDNRNMLKQIWLTL